MAEDGCSVWPSDASGLWQRQMRSELTDHLQQKSVKTVLRKTNRCLTLVKCFINKAGDLGLEVLSKTMNPSIRK